MSPSWRGTSVRTILSELSRSDITVDLGAIRRNARTLLRALDGRRALGSRQGRRLRARRGRRRARAALGAGATALCVATVPEALALRRALGPVADPRDGPGLEPRDRRGARRRPRARDRRRRDSRGRARPPEARHRDGALGPRRAARAHPRGRRADEPLRLGRLRRRVHGAAGRALPRGDGGALVPDAPHREQRRRAPLSRRRASTRPGAGSRSTASRRSAPILPTTGSSRRCAGTRSSRR